MNGVNRSVLAADFLAQAPALRSTFTERMQRRRPYDERSFVWDYWHVPDQYTYFRTFGERYFPDPLSAALMARLRAWGTEVLGCGSVTAPWLSYYIDGCVQELHCDVPHGPWAYVLSLTDWEHRGFSGGETLLLRPTCLDFWRDFDPSRGLEAGDLVDQIVPAFNQLTVFDARIPHGVRTVFGTRDPLRGRLVLHGWFAAPRIMVHEDLRGERTLIALQLILAHLLPRLQASDAVVGHLTVRLELDAAGEVRDTRVLTNTLISTTGDGEAPAVLVNRVLQTLRQAKVPGASDGSWAILPFALPTVA
ncbi:MAG: hypothetical protein ACR2OB_10690 [Solirubrobacteraceae bacterium]